MKTITVYELYRVCRERIREGHGNKKILISTDDEGNGYHELFYGINTNIKEFEDISEMPFGIDLDEYVLLG